ncbi:MAG: hypothetical protein IKF78_09565 [Atopobiaceae bacterium]|nr:hypothetical protein [Atopobiaceae bacterium]
MMYRDDIISYHANSLLRKVEGGMVNGNYAIYVNTLLGEQPGSVTLRAEGPKTFADINAPVIGKQFIEAQVEGNTFTAEGTFWLMFMGMIKYFLHGVVEGDDLRILIQSSKGNFDIRGTRI